MGENKDKAGPGVYHISLSDGDGLGYRARKDRSGKWLFADGTGWEDEMDGDSAAGITIIIGPLSSEELSSGWLSSSNRRRQAEHLNLSERQGGIRAGR